MNLLRWPHEAAKYPGDTISAFSVPGSNVALDFHGDPATAGLAVFSDGNHHMALEASVRAFLEDNPSAGDVFYTTTPPAPLVTALTGDGLAVGNLRISRKPDVFIGPQNIIEGLFEKGLVTQHAPFAESRGCVLLVRKGNPRAIQSIADLLADEVRLTCSNPVSEKASFEVYREAANNLATAMDVDQEAIITKLSVSGPRTVHSQVIHHREVPELIAADHADAAIIYYHLALRYTRIFPDIFELVDIGNVLTDNPTAENVITRYHIGVVGDGGEWGELFFSFMRDAKAQNLYLHHGLEPALSEKKSIN
ncbi:MAG: substrate-binding domain-containing protein [Acidiferrobacterales bacterium]|nr:substrate-binding domain-containing protein [Acidiferrobacterales bacterium]